MRTGSLGHCSSDGSSRGNGAKDDARPGNDLREKAHNNKDIQSLLEGEDGVKSKLFLMMLVTLLVFLLMPAQLGAATEKEQANPQRI